MPRIVNTTARADSRRVRCRSPWGDWDPFEDWTGHHYKPEHECVFDPPGSGIGRDVFKGRGGSRTIPAIPGKPI